MAHAAAAPMRDRIAIVITLALCACGVEPGGAAPEAPTSCEDGAPCPVAERACGDPVSFDPQGNIITARADDACVRLERTPADSRRGTVWRALRLVVAIDGAIDVDSDAPDYLSSHHNCQDEASAANTRVVIDGAEPDPSVCFSGDASAWRVRVIDAVAERVLTPD